MWYNFDKNIEELTNDICDEFKNKCFVFICLYIPGITHSNFDFILSTVSKVNSLHAKYKAMKTEISYIKK